MPIYSAIAGPRQLASKGRIALTLGQRVLLVFRSLNWVEGNAVQYGPRKRSPLKLAGPRFSVHYV